MNKPTKMTCDGCGEKRVCREEFTGQVLCKACQVEMFGSAQ